MRPEYSEIFLRYCATQGLDCPPSLLSEFIEQRYRQAGKPFRRCQPRDIVSHAMDLLHYERRPLELDPEILERSFESCFVDTSGME